MLAILAAFSHATTVPRGREEILARPCEIGREILEPDGRCRLRLGETLQEDGFTHRRGVSEVGLVVDSALDISADGCGVLDAAELVHGEVGDGLLGVLAARAGIVTSGGVRALRLREGGAP